MEWNNLKKILAIINPVSAGSKTEKIWPKYKEIFLNADINLDEVFTTHPEHAVQIAQEAAKNSYNYVMAVGGDGTVNEIINGLIIADGLNNIGTKLIIFAQGTGSDLIRSLDISSDINDVIEIIERKKVKYLDVVKAEYLSHSGEEKSRYFINVGDCGLGAEVVYRVNKSKKIIGGSFSYLLAVFTTLIKFKNKSAELIVDGKKAFTGNLSNVIIANGKYFGGGIKVAPQAELDNGKLNIILLKDFKKLAIAYNLFKAYDGKHLDHPLVESLTAKTIKISSEEKIALEIDGETIGTSPVSFSVFKQKIPILN